MIKALFPSMKTFTKEISIPPKIIPQISIHVANETLLIASNKFDILSFILFILLSDFDKIINYI